MTRREQILEVIQGYGEPIKRSAIYELMPDPPSDQQALSKPLNTLLRRGEIVRVAYGLYAVARSQTLTKALGIPARSTVAPVIPVRDGVELTPHQKNGTVQSLLEAIASSDDPKRYAGVIQEIGKVLAS